MPFHPEVLSEATLKDLARNMQMGSKTVLPNQPLKLSQAQELLARALGYSSWHATMTQSKAHLNKTGQQRLNELSQSVERASEPMSLDSLLEAVKVEAGVNSLDSANPFGKPNEPPKDARFLASFQVAQSLQAKIQALPNFLVDGFCLNHEEVSAVDGLLVVLLFKVFPKGVKHITLVHDSHSLCNWMVIFHGTTSQRARVVTKLVQALTVLAKDSTSAQPPSIDPWYQEFVANPSQGAVKWIARHLPKNAEA